MKKRITLLGFMTLSLCAQAQTVSYNLNSNPIVGFNNSAFGFQSQISNTTGNHNASSGNYSLRMNTTGFHNAAHGMNALRFNTTGIFNTATGSTALYNNTTGNNNTSTGLESMRSNTIGSNNAANGYHSLYNNNDGTGNAAHGYMSLFTNVRGNNNTAIGFKADVSVGNLTNASAIGANAIVTASDKMILGDNRVNVGIGLSGVAGGPQNKLEIDRTGASNPLSGLRLRDLANATPLASNNQVLSVVPSTGDVILTTLPSGGSGSGFGTCPAPTTLNQDALIQTNGFNVNFSSNVNSTGATSLGNFAFGDVQDCFAANLNLARVFIRNTFASGTSTPAPNVALRVEQNPIGAPGFYAAEFVGDVNVFGTGYYTNNVFVASDKRFKKDILKMESVSDKLKRINGYTYKMRTDEFKNYRFSDKDQIGFIAQELNEVFPQLVSEHKGGYLAVNYIGMVPVLLEAIKESNAKIDVQQQQIDELKAMVQALVGSNSTERKLNSTAVQLSDKHVVVLNQNVPNPYAESTVITYNIPNDFNKAQILFKDNVGKVIKVVELKEKGEGSLNVFASDLTNGIYSYSLVIDGKVVDSKQMIKN